MCVEACVYRSKSFDMIFQLTANPFIVNLIKRDEMTSFLSSIKKRVVVCLFRAEFMVVQEYFMMRSA